jgi:hypothetical protein
MSATLTPQQRAALEAELRDDRVPTAAADADGARGHLATLLDLPSVDLSITGGKITGSGSRASADIFLSNGDTIQFETLRDVATATKLCIEVTATTGAMPRLKAADAQLAVKLLRTLAEHEQTLSVDEISIDLGVSYLQSATVIDVDMSDQRQRWGAFSHLATIDPSRQQQTDGTPYAAATIVLRHTTGARYVRCGWFYTYARTLDLAVSQAELAHRMQRAGWQRRGSRGAIKATAPDRNAELSWTFYTVPAEWQETAR